jgi:hypothetical protein
MGAAPVSDDSPVSSLADEEVAFSRGFIEWWSREKEEPVPPRAWEALACAERKRGGSEPAVSSTQEH